MQNALTQETALSFDPRPADSGRAGMNRRPFQAKNPARPAVMHRVLEAQDKVPGRKQAPPHVMAGQGSCAAEETSFQVPVVALYEATYAFGLAALPMVMQNVPAQETADAIVKVLLARRGGLLMSQSLPSQMAARGRASPLAGVVKPTAAHIVVVAQETSTSPHAEGR